ncbi:MAG: hypothetical protein IMW89_16205 [Ktedonobacteraceae bacterium]|nr:hypothetical protein [Ktedonobacteraceae bacterium]
MITQNKGLQRHYFYGVLLFVLTVIVILFYYLNHPHPELNPDTSAYLHVVDRLRQHPYQLVDTWRLPGYPLLITLVYTLTGRNSLTAVGIAQAALFVVATLEIYILASWLLRRAWMAFFVALLVGTNLVILSYVKPIMSEGLALLELTTLALAVVAFLRVRSRRRFWLIVACMLLLLLTRPEWVYLPVPLLAYLLLATARKGEKSAFPLWREALLALALLYGVVGIYIAVNALTNHYTGMTAIENFNWMGKVLQYNMLDKAPPEYAVVSQKLAYYVKHIDGDPYHVLPQVPELAQDNFSPAGRLARSIILHHPFEFLLKSVPYFFASLTCYYDIYPVAMSGPYGVLLSYIKTVYRLLYNINILFPFCALTWLVLFCWRYTKSRQVVLEMGALVLLILYALIITTLGGYRLDDYMRVHTVFHPLLILVIWSSLLMEIEVLARKVVQLTRRK